MGELWVVGGGRGGVVLYRNAVIENCRATYTPQGTLSQETKFSLSNITFTDSQCAHQWAVIRTALCGLHTLPNPSSFAILRVSATRERG
jgi:hypothetical protein